MLTLLDEIHEAFRPIQSSAKAKEKEKAVKPFYDTIRETLGREFTDKFYHADAQSWCVEVDEAFTLGFRMGVRLIMEVLTPPAPTE